MTIAIGPFDLIEPVARGGMAEVWRGEHRAQRVPVAVKVVTPPQGREQAYREQFTHEVQAMARLHHPAVVRIHDYGEIDTATSALTRGALAAGAPYLAMEWLAGGSLRNLRTMDWPRLRATLLALLDALAHAHAHGVVHRDLKPDNVLIGDRGPVLTDFGLAVNPAVVGEAIGSDSLGTPGYMAPEQIRNDWRAFGPWTDLYAVGCMAYELATGHAPHADRHRGSAVGLLVAHIQEPLPALAPRFPVPHAFEQWLVRMMGRTPHSRFRFAADAAVALLGLPDEVQGPASDPSIRRRTADIPFAETMDAPSGLALAVAAAAERDAWHAEPPGDDDTLDIRPGPMPPPFERLPGFDEFAESAETDAPRPPETADTDPPGDPRVTALSDSVDAAFDALRMPDESGERGDPEAERGGDPADTLGDDTTPPGVRPPTTAELITDMDRDTEIPDELPPEVFDDDDPAIVDTAPLTPLMEARFAETEAMVRLATRGALVDRATVEALPSTGAPLAADSEEVQPEARAGAGSTAPPDRREASTERPGPATLQLPPVFLPITDDSWAGGPSADGRPPLPASWRRQREPTPPPMIDVGLALARMRVPPPVGREAERDHLWSALRSAVRGRARAVFIEGPAGQGKTHLAEWLARRAHELGTAEHLHAVHDRLPSSQSGPGAMLARFLRCADLEGAERVTRVEAALGPHGTPEIIAALASALPDPDDPQPDPRAEAPLDDQTLTGLLAGIEALTARRPVVILCDDVQWGPDTLQLLDALLESHPRLPVLAIATIREDALRDDAPARRQVAELARRGNVTRLRLDPLPPVLQFQLVRSVVPLAPNLVDRLVERSAGSPQFAIELVRHWISTGVLESSPTGFRLRDDDLELSLPGEQQALWLTRLDSALRGAEDRAVQALEIAAVLGQSVDPEEWSDTCVRARLAHPQRAFARLLAERLVRPEDDGRWAFTHVMLREALQQRARSGGRWRRWNGLCAAVLTARGRPEPVRLAEHLIAAGNQSAALEPLLDAADQHLDRAEFLTAERALRQRIRAQRALRIPLSDRVWTEVGLRWAHARLLAGDASGALRRARKAVVVALRRREDPPLQVEALIELGRALRTTEGPDAAWRTFARALERLPRLEDPVLATRLRSMAGRCLAEQGRYDAAERTLTVAVSTLRGLDRPRLRGDVLYNLADMARRRGQLERAERFITQAARAYYRGGARRALARAALLQGDVERDRKRFDEAASRYREAARMLRAVGASPALADVKQGLLLVELEQYRDARTVLLDALSGAADARMVAALGHACLLPCAASLHDWGAWDDHWHGMAPMRSGVVAEPDIARIGALAARLAEQRGRSRRAEDARQLAIRHYRALGRSEDADALEWGMM